MPTSALPGGPLVLTHSMTSMRGPVVERDVDAGLSPLRGLPVFGWHRVPEGAWTLLAWREIPHAKRPTSLKPSEARRYKTRSQVFGYTTVVFWRIPLEVKAGEELAVRLHDRNEWLTGTREDRRVPDPNQAAPQKGQSGTSPR